MSKDKETRHILIIGGGIAGKALALFLHKAANHPLSRQDVKYTCTIYEAYPPSEKIYIGGGLGLAPNGVAVLADLGLQDQVKKRTGVARSSRFWTEGGYPLGVWDHAGFEYDMYGMMRSTLYDILSEELQNKGLTIEYKKRASKIEEKGDKVIVQFEDGSTAEGDYIIGADGVKSAVRTQLFPGYPKPEFIGLNGAGGFVKKEDIPPNVPDEILHSMNFMFGKRAFFGIAPASDGGLMWWTNWVIPEEYTPEQMRDTSDVKAHAIKLFADRKMMYPCMELINATSLYIKQSIFDIRSLPAWSKSRACLIGDAAHAVSPNSGQGASLALEDASLLALLLTRSSSSPEEIFAQMEKSRRDRVEAIIEAGRRQKRNKKEVSTFGMYFRNAFIMVMFKLMGVKKLVGKAWMYRVDWEEKDVGKVVKWYKDGKLVPAT